MTLMIGTYSLLLYSARLIHTTQSLVFQSSIIRSGWKCESKLLGIYLEMEKYIYPHRMSQPLDAHSIPNLTSYTARRPAMRKPLRQDRLLREQARNRKRSHAAFFRSCSRKTLFGSCRLVWVTC